MFGNVIPRIFCHLERNFDFLDKEIHKNSRKFDHIPGKMCIFLAVSMIKNPLFKHFFSVESWERFVSFWVLILLNIKRLITTCYHRSSPFKYLHMTDSFTYWQTPISPRSFPRINLDRSLAHSLVTPMDGRKILFIGTR